MKKFILSVMMMTVALTTAEAQEKHVPMMQLTPAVSTTTTVSKIAPRRALDTNQKYMGMHESDNLGVNGFSIKKGEKVGTILPANYVKKYDGAKILGVRYAAIPACGGVRVFVATVNNGEVGDDLASQANDTTIVGWNEVMFDNPCTISADGTNTLLIGFENLTNAYQHVRLYGEYREGGIFLCHENDDWGGLCSDYGNVNVQCIVEKEGINEVVDVSVHKVSTPAVAKKGETTKVKFRCFNFSNVSTTCDFGISIDGSEVATLNGCTVNGDTATFSIDVPVDNACAEAQKHDLAVYLKNVNGGTPEGDTSDDRQTTSFIPYTKTAQRQMNLFEGRTGTWCYACTLSDKGFAQLLKQRDDIACVAMFFADDLDVSDSYAICSFMNGSGMPYGSFNRCLLDGKESVAYSLGWKNTDYLVEKLNGYLEESIEKCPTFAKLDISTTYNDVSRLLNITVKGTGVEHAAQIMDGDILTVYLTEDSVVATQWNGHEYDENYVHNAVLRKVLTGRYGNTITWNGDNFEMTYSATLDDAWDAQQMHVVAATSRTFRDSLNRLNKTDVSDAWVSNASSMAVKDATSGIESAVANSGSKRIIAYYSLDGQRLVSPRKGINIIRFSDGTTKKVVVR